MDILCQDIKNKNIRKIIREFSNFNYFSNKNLVHFEVGELVEVIKEENGFLRMCNIDDENKKCTVTEAFVELCSTGLTILEYWEYIYESRNKENH